MKRFLSLILALILIVASLSSCSLPHFGFGGGDDNGGDKNNDSPAEEIYITRAEWAELLCLYFGIDTCTTEQPYFVDVVSTHPLFACVQACVEWEIFDLDKSKFNPNEYATIEFVVESAINASEIKCENKLAYAAECGIISSATDNIAKTKATFKLAYNCAIWAVELYQSREFIEYENVVLNSSVIARTFPSP